MYVCMYTALKMTYIVIFRAT